MSNEYRRTFTSVIVNRWFHWEYRLPGLTCRCRFQWNYQWIFYYDFKIKCKKSIYRCPDGSVFSVKFSLNSMTDPGFSRPGAQNANLLFWDIFLLNTAWWWRNWTESGRPSLAPPGSANRTIPMAPFCRIDLFCNSNLLHYCLAFASVYSMGHANSNYNVNPVLWCVNKEPKLNEA